MKPSALFAPITYHLVLATSVAGWYAKTMGNEREKQQSARGANMMIDVTLGMDDIDSPRGGCTTHFASLVVEALDDFSVQWADYPNLVRLNPNIPFRTRGNGAVALRFSLDRDNLADLLPLVSDMARDYIERGYPNTNPGIVVIHSEIPPQVEWFAEQATWRAVSLGLARRILVEHNIDSFTLGNGRGIVGALAAIGNGLDLDYTYEFIAYRPISSCSEPRSVLASSVRLMDQKFSDTTFSNIDYETGYILIEPHGPDPVLYGIRGENPRTLKEAADLVNSEQSRDRWMIFRTNQGTGEHLRHLVAIKDLRPYMSARVSGYVSKKPEIIEGGHVIFEIQDASGKIDCAAYEPTGGFRKVVNKLLPNDELILSAGVRPAAKSHEMTLNIEGMEIVDLVEKRRFLNPLCPECGKRLKSAGHNKGFKCSNCGFRSNELEKNKIVIERDVSAGVYLPPPRAQRHLTRPSSRLSKSNNGFTENLIEEWHCF